MDKKTAMRILKDAIDGDNLGPETVDNKWYICWIKGKKNTVCLDGDFTMEELKAITWWLENT